MFLFFSLKNGVNFTNAHNKVYSIKLASVFFLLLVIFNMVSIKGEDYDVTSLSKKYVDILENEKKTTKIPCVKRDRSKKSE